MAASKFQSGVSLQSPSAAVRAVLVVLAAGLVYLPSIIDVPFHTKGEPREAIVVQQMVERGELVSPLLHRGEIPSKPPLFHWLGAIVSSVAGRVSETTVRIPSVVSSLILIAATVAAGSRTYGSAAGLAAGAVLATSQQWIQSSTAARVDMVLAVGLTYALLAFWRAYEERRPYLPVACYLACAAAVLTKGPIGYVLPLLVIAVAWSAGRDPALLRLLRPQKATLLLLLPLLWYLPAWLDAGRPFLEKLVWKENVYRVLDARGAGTGHVEPFYYYGPALLGGLAPWSLLLPALALDLWRRRTQLRQDASWFLLVWVAVTLGLFSLAGSKRGVYLLPAYPPIALLLGALVARRAATARPGATPVASGRRAVAGFVGLVIAAVALIVAAETVGLPLAGALGKLMNAKDADNLAVVSRSLQAHWLLVLSWVVIMLGASVFMARSITQSRVWHAFYALTGVIGLTAATIGATVLRDMAKASSLDTFMAEVARTVPQEEPLSFYPSMQYVEYFKPAAVYYADRPIPVGFSPDLAPGPERVWILGGEHAYFERCRSDSIGRRSPNARPSYDCNVVLRHSFGDSRVREPLLLIALSQRLGEDRHE